MRQGLGRVQPCVAVVKQQHLGNFVGMVLVITSKGVVCVELRMSSPPRGSAPNRLCFLFYFLEKPLLCVGPQPPPSPLSQLYVGPQPSPCTLVLHPSHYPVSCQIVPLAPNIQEPPLPPYYRF